jgi:two-component system CheB/CheR fusion protein
MAAKRRGKSSAASGSPKAQKGDGSFAIVGMGASAGGLQAFEQFFRLVPSESGMAFVLVPHLDPGHESMLTEILQRTTTMPVVEAKDQMPVAPNHVYVIPPNRELTLFHGTLQISVPEAARGQRMLIDAFFRSVAEDQGEKAICVILSGTGTDGTLGLRAVHGAGGVSFVQEPGTAKYDGMPASAVESGLATYVLPVEKMPGALMSYAKAVHRKATGPVPIAPSAGHDLGKILQLLRSRTGHDFSLYKKSTVGRRVERRMAAHGIEAVATYAHYLQEHVEEVQLLFRELLINVTSFFRDPEAFDAMKRDILPRLFADKPEKYVFRVWVPGCATGEEAYSIAILFREYMEDIKQEYKVQVYATDIHADAIASARSGAYPPNIAMDVPSERLRRFFAKEETGHRIRKDIREMVVFAVQNVIKDPPFTKLDMVSCRNVLIYFEPELQDRLFPTFHYALRPGGVLFLSPSESIGDHTALFSPLSRKHKFYQARPTVASVGRRMAGGPASITARAEEEPEAAGGKAQRADVADLTKRLLLQSFAPPSVVTDETGGILYVHGDTGKCLRPAPGRASLNIIEMAREGLQLELRTAIHDAVARKKPVFCGNLQVKADGGVHGVDLSVRPMTEPDASPMCLIVSFVEPPPAAKKGLVAAKRSVGGKDARRVEELAQSLLYTRESLHANIEELQAANEELKSTNEELQSTNEELQSTNEEMETAKEELQSLNEELVTVNAELGAKNERLAEMQSDLKNLLDNTDGGTIFLDGRLVIKRFTRQAATVYRLVASDVGRPLGDIKSNIEGDDLVAEAHGVLDSLVPREKQVRTIGQEQYRVRIIPYRTLDNVIEGVVLAFTDITKLKKVEADAQAARDYARGIVDTIREPLIVLDGGLTVISASRSFYRLFGVAQEHTVGRHFYELGDRQWDIPRLRELLETILPRDTSFEDVVVEEEFASIGRRKLLLNARRIAGQTGQAPLILLAMQDVTGHSPAAEAGGQGKGRSR